MATTKKRNERGKAKAGGGATRRAGTDDGREKALRAHLVSLLRGRNAHVDAAKAFEGIAEDVRGRKPEGLPYSPWQLLEHMRIAQWDILEFSRDPKHVSPAWPAGYWPATAEPPGADAWDRSLEAFRAGLKAMERLVSNPRTDLYAEIAHGEGQTILREALLVADHNAYHLGQVVLLRRLLGAWEA